MDKERILTPAVVVSVALLHLAMVALLWQAHKPPVVDAGNIEAGMVRPKAQVRLLRLSHNPSLSSLNLSSRPNRF